MGAQVDGDDVGAFLGEADRMRPALPAGGPGDEDDLVLEQAARLPDTHDRRAYCARRVPAGYYGGA
ncbi:hypothetical protein [Mycolicibacterium poriferae]|uniref:hypothetical protein n=1 Tax=Mycolicibacterium poriferae TaxID=39694 RepID=UPI0024B98679|nr:hypothetical protein [Mycolicibacterium poriferae]